MRANNRSGVDFSKHELFITDRAGIVSHQLKLPDTSSESIKFINIDGVLLVKGDFSYWVFCREFHPSAEGSVSDRYWIEKLKIASSCRLNPYRFDGEATQKILDGYLNGKEEDGAELDPPLDAEEKEYIEGCIDALCDGEWHYEHYAHTNNCGRFSDHEYVPLCKDTDIQLKVVFDAFEEICNRIKPPRKTKNLTNRK